MSGIWVLFLYHSILGAPFVYDDLDQIVKNPHLSSFQETFRLYCLQPSAFTAQFRGIGGTNFRPLFWLSLSLDRHIWGADGAGGFHFTNIVFHWINGFLLFTLLRRICRSGDIAAATALIWLGMPINSEAVAWVSAREYILCGFFLLLALHAAHSFLRLDRATTTSSIIGVFGCSLAALLSHESGILLIPLMLLLAYSMGTLFKCTTAILMFPVVLSTLIFWGVRQLVGAHSGGGRSTLWAVALTFWKYVLWIVAPIHMSMQRATSTPPDSPSWEAIGALCAVFAVCMFTFILRNKAPLFAAGVTCAIITILPFCGIVYIYQGMAERFCYFASVGLALTISSLIFHHQKTMRNLASVLAIVWVGWGTWRLKSRVLDWCDPVALYESSVEATPDPMLYYNLGWAWRDRGDSKKALAEYKEAVRLRPNYQEAQASVGQMLTLTGHPKEASPSFERALALKPEDSPTRVDWAITLEQIGDEAGAEREFRKALQYSPGNYTALNDYGSLLVQEGRADDAISYFQKAIQTNANDPNAYFNLGALFLRMGQKDKALASFHRVLELKPDDIDTMNILANIYAQH